MHDTFNTLNGRFGFYVRFNDGTDYTEFVGTWDELPNKTIKKLSIFDSVLLDTLVDLEGFDRYFFSNEATSCQTVFVDSIVSPGKDGTVLAGKVLGGVKYGEGVTEIRIDLTGSLPTASQSTYPESALRFAPHTLRQGVVEIDNSLTV